VIKHKIVQQKKVIVLFLFVLKFQTFLNNIYFTKKCLLWHWQSLREASVILHEQCWSI